MSWIEILVLIYFFVGAFLGFSFMFGKEDRIPKLTGETFIFITFSGILWLPVLAVGVFCLLFYNFYLFLKSVVCRHKFLCINLNEQQITDSGEMIMECQKCGKIKIEKYKGG